MNANDRRQDRRAAELAKAGKELARIMDERKAASHRLRRAILFAIAGGMSESEAARVAGVDRMTVRRALGKR